MDQIALFSDFNLKYWATLILLDGALPSLPEQQRCDEQKILNKMRWIEQNTSWKSLNQDVIGLEEPQWVSKTFISF